MRNTLIPALAASLLALTLPMGSQAEPASGPAPHAQAGQSHGRHDSHSESRGHASRHSHASHHGAREQVGMMGMSHRDGKPGGMSPRGWLQGLDLSEAQRDKVFEIMHAQAPRMREQAKLVRTARAELGGLTTAPALDPAQLKAASDKLARALADMSASRVSTRNQIFQLLTPEQKQQLQARLTERGGRGGMGPGNHRPGQHGEGQGHGGRGQGKAQHGSAPEATVPTQAS